MENPFYHRGAIRRAQDFHNREAEISQILGLLRNGQSVSLIGPRRIGKSSLLIHLSRAAVRTQMQLQPPNALFVLIIIIGVASAILIANKVQDKMDAKAA